MESLQEATDSGFDALVEAMQRSPRPLALLGAGTSVDSGYPDWNGLLRLFKDRAIRKIGNKRQGYLDSLNDPAWQAEEYRRLLGENDFRSLIASEFAPKGKIGDLLHAIVRMKFRHILTTNYDSCIERAYEAADEPLEVVDWMESEKLRQFFLALPYTDGTPYLVYLHGRFYDPGNVVLTESSYADRYVRSDDAQRKLFAILITQPVVFIGFSINDPDLNHLMREVNARLGKGGSQHFALIGYEADWQRQLIRDRLEGKFGIRPVFYRIEVANGRQDHGDLLRLLERLRERVFGPPSVPLRSFSLSVGPPPAPPARADDDLAPPMSPAPAAPVAAAPADSLDQQKGRWGGRAESNGRRLRVENIKAVENLWCEFDLVVESTDAAAKPLEGEVEFHLHQTFRPDVQPKTADNGQARLTLTAYGAFTVGALADGGATRLELDLAQVDALPSWFRER